MTVNWRALPERLRRFDPAAVDFNNPGTWPLPVRIGMLAAACVVVLAGGYQWFLAGSIERLEMLQRQEEELRRDYEHKAGFYAELPVEMSVEGGYHELGAFVSRVAGLPRIVTLHDFDLEPPAPDRGIRMHVLAKTYRYLGGKEEA